MQLTSLDMHIMCFAIPEAFEKSVCGASDLSIVNLIILCCHSNNNLKEFVTVNIIYRIILILFDAILLVKMDLILILSNSCTKNSSYYAYAVDWQEY